MQEKIHKGIIKSRCIESVSYPTADYKLLLTIKHQLETSKIEFESYEDIHQHKFEILSINTQQIKNICYPTVSY